MNFWERYQAWKKTPEGQRRSGSELIGSPDTIRERLNELDAANVDQVILLNQAGKNTHESICESLELFAKTVMPEFVDREEEHLKWKEAVLAGDIQLDDIDTDPFNARARGAPALPPSEELRDMVSGAVGRPSAQRSS